MSLITPLPQNTLIKAYTGVPWDRNLRDIRLFDTESQRNAFFAQSGRLKGQWNNCSIVSIGKSIRVEADYNACLECNYLSFQNVEEGQYSRVFYAYVTSVEYVNVNTVQFSYEIDWIQTYLFDFVIGSFLVEREHVNDDTQGKYILEEGISFGEYQVDRQTYMDFNPALVVNILQESYAAQLPDNMYVPGVTYVADITKQADITYLNTKLEAQNATPERVTAIFMGVVEMQPNDPDNPASTFFHKTMQISEDLQFLQNAGNVTGAYVPQNKKLLCAPYKFLTADNYTGSVNQYRWECFNSVGTADFAVEGSAMPKPAMQFFPIDYRKVTNSSTMRNTYEQEGLWYENFPAVNYVSDTFKAWVSQYGTSFAVENAASIGMNVVGMAANIATGNFGSAVGNAASAVTGATSAYQEYKDHKLHSLQSHGGVSTSGLAYARDSVGFRITAYSIRQEDAKRIDKYFTRYGYRVEEVKVPNIRGRQYCNYVRGVDSVVNGNVAVDAKLQLERALDQGTTFWHTDDIGADLTSNPIVSG